MQEVFNSICKICYIKQKKAEEERLLALQSEYNEAKLDGRMIRRGVMLQPEDRKMFFNAAEIKEIIAIRREKLSISKARMLLGCTLSEINSWDESGLLPHAFKQVIQAGGKAVEARFWIESEVFSAKPIIEDWRNAPDLKKNSSEKNHH